MNYINREITKNIEKWLFKGKILILQGARQVGKTTLVKDILKKYGNDNNYYNCEEIAINQRLQTQDPDILKNVFGDAKVVILDEAHKIRNIGLVLKVFHDRYPDTQIVATGSSSFALSNKIGEPLTGRAITFFLYPISINELRTIYKDFEIINKLGNFLTFGMYPEIIFNDNDNAITLLNNLASGYLYRDILEFENIRKSEFLIKLLQLLAYQVSNEVSIYELSKALQINRETVSRYIDLLEKSFVIYRLNSFSRNLRNEISKKFKIYFYDLGIRNSIISRFDNIEIRDDIGKIWENLMINERIKYVKNNGFYRNIYFWRTTSGSEIDYIEEYDGKIYAYEFKYNKDKFKIPKIFMDSYLPAEIKLINKNNFLEFV